VTVVKAPPGAAPPKKKKRRCGSLVLKPNKEAKVVQEEEVLHVDKWDTYETGLNTR